MSRQRQELCRNFQRGSCRYGAQCKFLHAPQQQVKQQQQPNPFGFGSRALANSSNANQQNQPNPFGFGNKGATQSTPVNHQPPNPFGFGANGNSQSRNMPHNSTRNQGPVKPFQNTWTRNSASGPPKKTDTQTQAPVHNDCTDPGACKQQIIEDFSNEMPSWKLTCYGHRKSGPCDITGDISMEELRTAAYDDARQGRSLNSIVEREKNLLNAKLVEFESLFRNPYVPRRENFASTNVMSKPINSSSHGSSPLPVFSSFSQLGAAASAGNAFHAPSPGQLDVLNQSNFQKVGHVSNGSPMLFGVQTGANSFITGGGLGVNVNNGNTAAPLTQSSHNSSLFNFTNYMKPSENSSSTSTPPLGISNGPNTFNPSNAFSSAGTHQLFPKNSAPVSGMNAQPLDLLHRPAVPSSSEKPSSDPVSGKGDRDDSIWLKESWTIGEIPEDEPPSIYCH